MNRELLRTATYVPVKRLAQLHEGVKVMTAQVNNYVKLSIWGLYYLLRMAIVYFPHPCHGLF